MARIRWILFLFLSIPSVSFGENLSEVNQAVEKSLKFWNAPGAAVVIIKDGRIALTKGYGVKDFQTQSSVDEHTLFQIASLTKPITAYLTGTLAAEQKVAFEDPIKRFVPDFKLSDSYATDHLTIRDCLSMHAGLPGPEVLNIWYEGNKILDQVLAEFAKLPLPCGFRGYFGYQNVLYSYVSQVIEKIQKIVGMKPFSKGSLTHFR